MQSKPILCLDFDGVCHSYTSGWIDVATLPVPPVPGMFEFIKTAQRHFRVAIYSSRSEFAAGRDAMQDWFAEHARKHYLSLAPDGTSEIDRTVVAQDLTLDLMSKLEFPASKPAAFVTLDDRAVTFKGTWPEVTTLRGFVTWNDHLIKKAPRNTVVSNG